MKGEKWEKADLFSEENGKRKYSYYQPHGSVND